MIVLHEQAADLLALDEALQNLTTIDARQSRLVELRFFGGLSIEETAEVLKVSPGTVMREWTFAKACIGRRLASRFKRGRYVLLSQTDPFVCDLMLVEDFR